MELGMCANLLRLSLEGFRQREEPSLRSLRPPRFRREYSLTLGAFRHPPLPRASTRSNSFI